MKSFPASKGACCQLDCVILPEMSTDPEAEARSAIDLLFSLMEQAWNRADVDSYSHLYADDVGYVNRFGALLEGRDEVARIHAEAFAGWLHDTKLRLSTKRFRLLAPGVALAQVDVVTNADTPNCGDLRAIATIVIAKTEADWRVAALHVSEIRPGP